MAQRRGRGEGSLTRRPDGRWQARIDLGRGADGKRRRKSVYGATQAEAIEQLRRLGGRAVDGQLLNTSTPTLARYLRDWYATNSDGWRASTRRGYISAIEHYLIPTFGTLRVEQLTPQLLQRWLTAHKEAHGARRRIELAHAVLRSALSEARRLQLVATNAAELVKVPRPMRRPIRTLSQEQAAVFLRAAQAHRLRALFSVALACGLRLGEATGLRWDDVNLDTGELRVRQQLQRVGSGLELQALKTEKSRRTLLLPDVCIAALREHRKLQLAERLKAGEHWTDTGLVFTTYAPRGEGCTQGAPLHPRNVLRALYDVLDAAGLPRMRFHDLRHSAASVLLAEGVQLAEVSQLLGHSELRLTADLYSHLQQQTAAKAARIMDRVFAPSARK